MASSVSYDQREVSTKAAYLLAVLSGLLVLGVVAVALISALLPLLIFAFIIVIVLASYHRSAPGLGVVRSIAGAGSGLIPRPSAPGRPGPQTLDIARFRVVDGAKTPYDCELLGVLRVPPPKVNDDLQLQGRRRRDGVVQVRRMTNVTTGTQMHGRVPVSVLTAQAAPWAAAALIILAVAYLLLLRS